MSDRAVECARLGQLLAETRKGESRVLVLRGEPGIGKSTLLEYVADLAGRSHVLRAVGTEWEAELPFAGLHQLCQGLLDRRTRLPQPQADALATAFGLSEGTQPDRFLLSLAVLGLLSDAAEEHPLVCLVDDVQWLDGSSAQVLAFVARRLAAEPVLLLFAEREPSRLEELVGLPEMRVDGLPEAYARQLLASAIAAPIDERVRARILAETRGNPLALLELPREVETGGAGGFAVTSDASVPHRIEASFDRRVKELPAETQRLLLLAAADPTGEPALLARACEIIDIPAHKLSPAETEGLLEIRAQVTFRHPLLRSAIYSAASSEERRTAHQALAAATDSEADADRYAWHRAHSTAVPDEEVALLLEQSASRAQARGGIAAAAAFLERAAMLTPDTGRQAQRLLNAAATKHLAGSSQEALRLIDRAAFAPLDAADQARMKLLHAEIVDLGRTPDAAPLLLDAARHLEPFDPLLSREAYLSALRAATAAGRFGPGTQEIAHAALKAPEVDEQPRAMDYLLDGLAIRFTDGYAAGAPSLKRALRALRDEGASTDVSERWPWLGRRTAPEMFDDESWHDLATRSVERARGSGALLVLPIALMHLSHLRCVEGALEEAGALLDEADDIVAATGTEPFLIGRLTLAGYRGIEGDALALFTAAETASNARGGEGIVLTFAEHARAVLYNGLGRYEAALSPACSAVDQDELLISVWSLAEAVEAATRCGDLERARGALSSLAERTDAAGTELALGIQARSAALLSDAEDAEALYREAIAHLQHTRAALEIARARLLFGEWLRRQGRRIEARLELRVAYDDLAAMGVEAFAERARRELVATGEKVRKRSVETRDELTAQETQIVRLACDGLTNQEIGTRLFISARTVEWHLGKVFSKLGIRSRRELPTALAESAPHLNAT